MDAAAPQRVESPVKQALREIRRLRDELAAERARRAEPIAIVGMGVRLPGGVESPDAYWHLLANGIDAVGPVPRDRWSHEAHFDEDADAAGKYYVKRGGFLSAVDGFDPEFFGISPLEAVSMDPQQRLLLETVWEALEHAAIPATALHGTRTGVFLGVGATDYHRMVFSDPAADTYATTGTVFSVAAGRISYVLGLNGPAVAVDTACSSSLVAVHLACQSLRSGESDTALAAGVSLMLTPELTVNFCRARMLSRDGRCKTFDATADGYVRSEGAGVVVLKRLSDALRDGDHIHAVVRGSAMNQDGRSSGLTAPSGPAQEAVLRDALRDAGLNTNDLDYIEAHGTGTSLGDPIEVQAIGAVFGKGRATDRPLMLGSVKTNLGHLEAAAGIAGLIKVALSLEHAEIPPNLHFDTPNPHIPWATLPVAVPTKRTPWSGQKGPRRAGVSSFGFSGTNAHVVLEEAPRVTAPAKPATMKDVLVLSAPHEDGLRALAARYAEFLGNTREDFDDICRVARTGRVHFEERLALVAGGNADAKHQLEAWLKGDTGRGVFTGRGRPTRSVAVAFVFGDVELHAPARLQALADSTPVVRQALDECDAVLRDLNEPGVPSLFPLRSNPSPAYAAVFTFAAQYALGRAWRSLGLEPELVAGAGIGEYAAAEFAGIFGVRDAVRLTIARTRSTTDAPAAVQSVLQSITFRTPVVRYVSAASGNLAPNIVADAAYWVRQMGVPTPADALVRITRDEGITRIVEIDAANPATARNVEFVIGAALGSDEPWHAVLEGAAKLYVRGVNPSRKSVQGRRVALPTYPFHRRRFWHTPSASAAVRPAATPVAVDSEQAWLACTSAAAERSALAPIDMNMSAYADAWRALNELTELLGANALAELGAFTQPDVENTVADILDATGIRPTYTRIVERWLDALVNAGVLTRTSGGYIARERLHPSDAGVAWRRVEEKMRADQPLLAYVRHSAGLLAEVLNGRTSALETLFPGGSFDLAEQLYHNSTLLRYVNGIAAAAASAYVRELPSGRPVRVLEVGAGTGGTTAPLLKVLPAERVTYVYTDVSDIFLDFAAARFADAPFLRTALFDLERDPEVQDIAVGAWDIVVAANVIHAARDIRQAIDRVKRLLAPGGLLLLVESTGHHPWHDITTGLIEGWQHFEDDLRTDTPLLSTAVWRTLLQDAGFDDAATFPSDESQAAVLKQHVVIARAPVSAVQEVPINAPIENGDRPAPVVEPVNAGGVTASVAAAEVANASTPNASALVLQILQSPAAEREEIAAAAVRDCVMAVLRSDPSRPPSRDARLLDLGLDSLMAVRLRNQLQKKLALPEALPSTLVFDYPTIRHIARLIVKRVVPDVPVEAVVVAETAVDIASLSDAEVETLLLKRLESEAPA